MPPIVPAEIEAVLALTKAVGNIEKVAANAKLMDEALSICRDIVPKNFMHPFPNMRISPATARAYEVGPHAVVECRLPPLNYQSIGNGDRVRFIESVDGTRIMAHRNVDLLFAPDGSIASFIGKNAQTHQFDGALVKTVHGVDTVVGATYKQILEQVGVKRIHRWDPNFVLPPPPVPRTALGGRLNAASIEKTQGIRAIEGAPPPRYHSPGGPVAPRLAPRLQPRFL